MSIDEIRQAIKTGYIPEVVVLQLELKLCLFSLFNDAFLDKTKAVLNDRNDYSLLINPSDPFFPLVKEFHGVVCHNPPSVLPSDRGVRHESDLVPEIKYCVTRQWPSPKEQFDVIDELFRAKHVVAWCVRVNLPTVHPIFCVKKLNGKWLIVNAYVKLNANTIPLQTVTCIVLST